MDSQGDPRVQLEPGTPEDEEAGVRRFSCDGGDWRATGVVAVGRPSPAIRSIEVRAADPAADVTASLFRRVSIGLIVAEIQKELEADDARRLGVESMDDVTALFLVAAPHVAEDDIELPLPEGYVRMTDTLLRRVAEEYLRVTAPDQPPRALERLAETFGRPQETVRTWVARARKAGWLGQGVRGRAGAGPGPRLLGLRASEEAQLRARAAELPDGVFVRTSVKPDRDGAGGTVIRDSIPAKGSIERTEEHVDDWRAHVDALDGHAD